MPTTVCLLHHGSGCFEHAWGLLRRGNLGEVMTHLTFPTVHHGGTATGPMLLPLRRQRIMMLLLLPVDGLGRHEQRRLSLTLFFTDLLLCVLVILMQLT